ncbi:PAAR domain-containing protein [Enterobacter soli]|uniref:PAAR domain-containing protein n=1 Tax=Enterobacter soli TaxID=885040 RepID=UPI0034CD5420
MAKGYFLVQGDQTTCGGRILEGASDHTLFGKAIARDKDRVSCGKHPGTFLIAGGIPNDTIHGRNMAGTLDSVSTCPCNARFVPSMLQDTYEGGSSSAPENDSTEASPDNSNRKFPSYLTGEKSEAGFVSDYPVLKNTLDLPDENLRMMLKHKNQDVMLLTLPEVFEILSSWGAWKNGWVTITDSIPGKIVVNYGTNIKDVVTTSMIISQLGSFGIKATVYVNHKGTELIKISGYPAVRKILKAPVFAAKNPKIVDIGIGKYGLAKSIISGARLTFYVAAAYRTIDYIMNDETSLSEFIDSLATDVIKIGIASAVVWGVGLVMVTPWIVANMALVVAVGAIATITLNVLDDKFGMTDKIVAYIESAQQEFAYKAREAEKGILDLGAMYAEQMLIKGKQLIEEEFRNYVQENLMNIRRRLY